MPENLLTQFIIGLVVTLAYLWTHVSFKMHVKKPSHRIEIMEYLTYIWAYVFGNVGKYIIHGSYGFFSIRKVKLRQPLCEYTSRAHAIDGTLPAAVMILNMDRSHIDKTTTINHATYHPVGRAYSNDTKDDTSKSRSVGYPSPVPQNDICWQPLGVPNTMAFEGARPHKLWSSKDFPAPLGPMTSWKSANLLNSHVSGCQSFWKKCKELKTWMPFYRYFESSHHEECLQNACKKYLTKRFL